MTVTIKVFHVGEKCFKHVKNTNQGSVELRDEGDAILLTYGSDAKVSNPDGPMGSFHVEFLDGQPRWVFYEKQCDTRIVLGPDRTTAEVEVSKRYLGMSGLAQTEHGQFGA